MDNTMEHITITQCYKCHQWASHLKPQCTEDQSLCRKCGQTGHMFYQCSVEISNCINCDGPHPANARCCPVYKEALERVLSKYTDNITNSYSTPNKSNLSDTDAILYTARTASLTPQEFLNNLYTSLAPIPHTPSHLAYDCDLDTSLDDHDLTETLTDTQTHKQSETIDINKSENITLKESTKENITLIEKSTEINTLKEKNHEDMISEINTLRENIQEDMTDQDKIILESLIVSNKQFFSKYPAYGLTATGILKHDPTTSKLAIHNLMVNDITYHPVTVKIILKNDRLFYIMADCLTECAFCSKYFPEFKINMAINNIEKQLTIVKDQLVISFDHEPISKATLEFHENWNGSPLAQKSLDTNYAEELIRWAKN